MFWIALIHTLIIPIRKSSKYFQVSASGPSDSADVFEVAVITASYAMIVPKSNVDNTRCLHFRHLMIWGGIDCSHWWRNGMINSFIVRCDIKVIAPVRKIYLPLAKWRARLPMESLPRLGNQTRTRSPCRP
ncbi:hypothetical protein MLPF_1948 [Mycobacterium lepromatosis]|nr:hypothetical protein MLPF_1948 [Mycobacterium lepromatosis]